MTLSAFAEEAVLLDVGSLSGASFEEFNYSIENWNVEFNGGANTTLAKSNSEVIDNEGRIAMKAFVGNVNSAAIYIVPPYKASFNQPNIGVGLLENVGALKSLSISIKSYGYCNSVKLYLNHNGKTRIVEFKKDDFVGEETFTYDFPDYIQDVKDRELKVTPIYPNSSSNLYLEKIEVHYNAPRPEYVSGYDFIEIGNISVIYDKAYLDEEKMPDIFGLDAVKANKEKSSALDDLRQKQKLEAVEIEKQHKDESNGTSKNTTEISEK